jgi:hypothetical protein
MRCWQRRPRAGSAGGQGGEDQQGAEGKLAERSAGIKTLGLAVIGEAVYAMETA